MVPDIPGYDVDSELGSGGMGAVFRARHLSLDRTVALKIIHPRFVRDEGFVKGFAQEARIIARLDHPNIVSIYDFACTDGIYYLSMEYVQGSTLHELLVVRRPSQNEWIPIIKQVAQALDYAHQQQVVHRDIKPGNIMLCANGKSMVVDFGVAHSSSANAADSVWLAAGTRAYMSPEQCKYQPATARSDQYSLGVVVYELLTGRLPFTAPDPLAVMKQHISDVPPPLRTGRTDITPRIESTVLRALSKIPEMRFPSVGAFAKELEAAVNEAHSVESPIRSATTVASSRPREGLSNAPVSLVDGASGASSAPYSYSTNRIGYLNAVRSVSGKTSRSFGVTLLLLFVVTAAGAGAYFSYLKYTTMRAAEQAKLLAKDAAKSADSHMANPQVKSQPRRRNRRSSRQETNSPRQDSSAQKSPVPVTQQLPPTPTTPNGSENKTVKPNAAENTQEPKTPDMPHNEDDKAAKE